MLLQLHIENIAVIESANLSFREGFHVLTGETGAGKSMIIDALNMILGERVSRDLIRNGAEKAYVEALFESGQPELSVLLEEAGIPFEGELLISKELNLSGKSVCRINNRMVTAAFLRTVGAYLVNLHGQYDNQMLFQPKLHYQYLDRFAGITLSEYREIYARAESLRKELNSFDLHDASVRDDYERLRFEVDEIGQANLVPGEEEEIRKTLDALEHAEQIVQLLGEARRYLYDGEMGHSVYDGLGKVVRALSSAERYDGTVSSFCDRAQSLLPEVEELAGDLNTYAETVSLDRGQIAELHQRLNLIQHLKRKYGNSIEQVLEQFEEKKRRLDHLDCAESIYEELQEKHNLVNEQLLRCAEAITCCRRAAAERLQAEITAQLQDLDMNGTTFVVALTENKSLSPVGAETVEFLISPEPGSTLKPLTKIASGGEMSRTMLAIQVVLNESDVVSTLIFDEIDSGVSGRAAQKIARKLHQVAHLKQVLCITHLSQLAVMADVHYLIEKEVGERASTSVTMLDNAGRIRELARILSGADVTELTCKNAEEMLLLAEAYKKEQKI